ncbi:MAG: SapC family protein [Alphaproteobacteria bacterium]|nr:SapC family protein [Alphaproteobacteria bacterium]
MAGKKAKTTKKTAKKATKSAKKAVKKAANTPVPEAVENQPKGPMPLFYKNPIPLDAKAHVDLGLKQSFGLGFTKEVNAVPINMIEMPQICHFYPIGFSPDPMATPVAIVGLRDNENLFVNNKGEWAADTYIPAYIRRYPFIFSETPDGDRLALCIELNPDVIESKGPQPFFDKEDQPSQLSQNALEFCKSYHAAAEQTIAFGKALHEAGLLVERQAEIVVTGDKKINFSGFRIIDEKKLAELDDAIYLDWRKKGWIPFLYAHLFSGSQWQRLTQMLNQRMK